MAVHYTSDRDGSVIPDGERKHLFLSITIDAPYVADPITWEEHWDVTQADMDALRASFQAWFNSVKVDVQTLINVVENP